jgi:ATP-GRASP peptide maturase of grasp-with-spasm system
MILILSQSRSEPSTEEVMDWIERLGCCCCRINGQDLDGTSHLSMELSLVDGRLHLQWGGLQLTPAEVSAVWYRRWAVERRLESCDLFPEPDCNPKLQHQIYRHLTQECQRLSDFFFRALAGRPWLGEPRTSSLNKLHVLRCAASAGLDIPPTLVTTSRDQLKRFAAAHGRLITKPIGDMPELAGGDEVFMMYTAMVEAESIDQLPARFAPSLFQKCLDKSLELRVFYLDGTSYTMAIFSQLDPKTTIDFRRYNLERPNRTVPYRLKEQTAAAVCRLMNDLELATGSLDLILTRDGRIVFLEVNPAGQFGMVSKPCNYRLERQIAESLIARAHNE